ncbi:hypothetical protein PCYB_123290 [Plasmodium cynomolgi strain B]|uniref:Uncharacterized protein n=1 Tax=Plasmodium cynomolgi (strain B) TaxID=1120755 RepID=K6ULJ0_PLACD|nr:hypothetical protein PCYB_123290 [Plasmodium cynomolgi strain B]GAB67763.1 hypothetical protein PCYB_123290 [Plasmodium cynomolgi strain B]
MGFIINDAKKNDVIKTSPAEVNGEEATSNTYLSESNNGKKNGEECPGGNGSVPLSDGDTPGGEEPPVGSEDYVVANHGNEKEQPCDGTQTDNFATEETTINCAANPGEHAHWSGNKGSEREAFADETEQLPCDNGSDMNPEAEQNNIEPNGEGGMHSLGSGSGDHEGSRSGVFYLHGPSEQGHVAPSEQGHVAPSEQGHVAPTEDPNVLNSTIEQQESSFSFKSILINPNEGAVSTQDGRGSESIRMTNVQTSICSADMNTLCGGEQGVTVMTLPLESNPLEPNGLSGVAPQGVGKVGCANGEVPSQGEVPEGVTGHIAGGETGHLAGGETGHPAGEPPRRRKHPRSSEQKPPSNVNSDDGDESNHIIKKKIKRKVDENDQIFYAINEFMKEGLKNECIPLFERLQQNLFFLVMLANIPNENFDELESSSSDY